MCDCTGQPGYGWKGWRPLPETPTPLIPAGDLPAGDWPAGNWVDLSHPLGVNTPRVPFFPAPVFDYIRRLPEDLLNVTRMEMVVHIGTHVDAPNHFFLDAPAMDEVPLERLCGRGIVWPVQLDAGDTLIEVRHFDGLEKRLRPGDILVLDTGTHQYAGSARYDDDHPALSLDAADWIIAHDVKMIALDNPTPDLPVAKRPPDFDYPIHRRLLSHGVMIAEHLTNLSTLRGRDVEILCAALNIKGGDGAPARVLARPVQPDRQETIR